ncbi:non-ribosomal peptide synthetase [Cytobacillus firmus]|uniref:non-ribosomal peptide synthetase n=1 Tax=Cytobacillus firmus TaxID=1399 RepID=UPI002163D520|nr:non-ribosomal peptide synthetase [Cytobacillus firmus]MCS0670058.1 amino acid adenylation domain-containing protein [Cytobacillus firmus]
MTITAGKSYSLSPNQENLWRSHYLSSEQNHLNMFTSWLLPADADISALKLSFQSVLDRYASLRTIYEMVDGIPVMKIMENQTLDFQQKNLSHLSLEEFNKSLSEEAHTPFDLKKCTMKVRILENCIFQKVLLINIHHIAIDGISMMVIMKEFGRFYDLYSQGKEPEEREVDLKYFEFSANKEGQAYPSTESLEYWKKRLQGGKGIHPVNLPAKNSDHHSFKGDCLFFSIDEKLANALKETAKMNDSSLYIILLSAFQVLLHRYSQQKHIWVGTPFFNRTRKTLKSVGFYANTLYIDGAFTEGLTFSELLKQISEKFEGSKEHKEITYSSLMRLMQDNGLAEEQGRANVMFNFPNMRSVTKNNLGPAFLGIGGAKGKFGSLEFEVYPLKRNITQFEIEFDGIEFNGGITFRLLFDPEKYDGNLMKRFTGHFIQLLRGIAKNPYAVLEEYPLLLESEKKHQLNSLNHPQLLKNTNQPNLILEIEKQARLNPDSPAVTMGGDTLTYRELSEKSSKLAGRLKKLGICQEERIGLAVSQSVEAIVGIIGILKAGGVYIPLDLKYPRERLEYMIMDAGISKIITDGIMDLPVPNINFLLLDDLFHTAEEPLMELNPKQLAYIIYTSGSTGRPKGVMVSHENIYYSTKSREQVYKLNKACRFLLLSSISFDSSMVGIFWTLTVGGEIILTDLNNQLDVPELLGKIQKEKVTHMLSVPSFVQLMLNQAGTAQLRSLECVIVAGEPFPKSLHTSQKEKFPNIDLYNEYGPTEASVWSSYYRLGETCNHPAVPIGYPPAHARIYILDKHLNMVPQGTEGEIYICGRGITRGYNNRPSQTADKFIPNPFGLGERLYQTGDLARYNEDGSIHFLGRIDGQVKVNGFRIEVGEIEAAIEEQVDVDKAVVLLKKENNLSRIAAFIGAPLGISLSKLKRKLAARLPHYMVPSQFIVMDELPLTQNGKVDKKKLLKIKISAKEEREDILLPETQEERVLSNVVTELLGEEISMNDSFFEIGGDSIFAIQISSKLLEKGWTLKPKDIFEKKTIVNMARAMKKVKQKSINAVDHGTVPLTPIQQWFFAQGFLYQNHWNQALRLEVQKDIEYGLLQDAFDYLMTVHPSLKLRFFQQNGSWVQEYKDDKSSFQILYKKMDMSADIESEVSRFAKELQASLNITEGPLLIAAYIDCDGKRENELIIIAHHLIVDMISWQVLLQDLDLLLEQKLKGDRLALPPENFTYSEWSRYLRELDEDELKKENQWLVTRSFKADESVLANVDKGTEGSKKQAEGWLEKDLTLSLLKEVPKYFETKANEVIFAAVASSLKTFTGDKNLVIDLEGHGRDPFTSDIDLSRTVGWFTSVYPVFLEGSLLKAQDNVLLKHAKNSLRRFPNGGITYGVARWLKEMEGPQLSNSLFSYNYLGKVDQTFFRSKHFSFHSYLSESVKNPSEKRVYLLDFEPYIFNEQLCVRIHYSPSFSEEDIGRLCTDILTNIRELIRFCTVTEEIGLVASDFPEANLDQGALDKFLLSLKQSN